MVFWSNRWKKPPRASCVCLKTTGCAMKSARAPGRRCARNFCSAVTSSSISIFSAPFEFLRELQDKSFAIVRANLDQRHIGARLDCVAKPQRPGKDGGEKRHVAVERPGDCVPKIR